MPQTAKYGIGQFCLESIDIWNLQLLDIDYSKSFLVHWQYFPGCLSVLTNSFPSHHTFSYLLWFFSILTAAFIWSATPKPTWWPPVFFTFFRMIYPYGHFLKILSKSYRYICPKLAQVWPLCPRQPNMVLAIFTCKTMARAKKLSKSFLAQW